MAANQSDFHVANQAKESVGRVWYEANMPLKTAVTLWQQGYLAVAPADKDAFCSRITQEIHHQAVSTKQNILEFSRSAAQFKASTSEQEDERIASQIQELTQHVDSQEIINAFMTMSRNPSVVQDSEPGSDHDLADNRLSLH